jgi:uncharacterized protein YbaA (DUF1428 family)
MKYVDGFVIPVPKKKLATYKKWAKICSKVWLEHGAIEYVGKPSATTCPWARSLRFLAA